MCSGSAIVVGPVGRVLGLVLLAALARAHHDPEAGVRAWAAGRHAEAVAAWRPLAESGDPRAQFYLGYAYRRGRGVTRDDARALHWYLRAARQGEPNAQYQAGLMYELGLGTAADQAEADYWYSRAVGQGYCPGELSAGGPLGD